MIKIALAQIPVIPGQPDKNTDTICHYIQLAREEGADLVLFPALAVPGHLLGDTWEQPAFLAECEACGQEIVAATKDMAVLFGNVALDPKRKNPDGQMRKYSALFAAQNGALVAPKNFPYPFFLSPPCETRRFFDDGRYFCSLWALAAEMGKDPAELLPPLTLCLKGKVYTIGALLGEIEGQDDDGLAPLRLLESRTPLDFVVNLSSSPHALGENEERHRRLKKAAAALHAPVFYVNHVGVQNNGKTVYPFDGCSTVCDRHGEMRAAIPAYREALCPISLETLEARPALVEAPKTKTEALCCALAYGVRRFMDALSLERVVIGLSGGIDSAVSAALFVHVLGAKNVLLLNMPSRFNSSTTQGLAARLAENLGCRYAVLPIEEAVQCTIRQIESIPIQNLTVSPFMAENIQARDRSARLLAAAAAAFGGVFPCNANKAETTVGYSTLYGDQAGFFAPLADLWKHQIYDVAHFFNDVIYQREVIPNEIIALPPSAELSAAQNVECGEGDPLFYPYHDFLFRAFVERSPKATPEDILTWYAAGALEKELGCAEGLVKAHFPTPDDFIADLERWWARFTGLAVAKRIQSPPILAVSRSSYGADHREAQNGVYYTRKYRALKARLLEGHGSRQQP
ncbi:MAG: NAD(+) synthase [Schwartzia sp. (in: firmicutes)]